MAFFLVTKASHFIEIAVDLEFEATERIEEEFPVTRPPRPQTQEFLLALQCCDYEEMEIRVSSIWRAQEMRLSICKGTRITK